MDHQFVSKLILDVFASNINVISVVDVNIAFVFAAVFGYKDSLITGVIAVSPKMNSLPHPFFLTFRPIKAVAPVGSGIYNMFYSYSRGSAASNVGSNVNFRTIMRGRSKDRTRRS